MRHLADGVSVFPDTPSAEVAHPRQRRRLPGPRASTRLVIKVIPARISSTPQLAARQLLSAVCRAAGGSAAGGGASRPLPEAAGLGAEVGEADF